MRYDVCLFSSSCSLGFVGSVGFVESSSIFGYKAHPIMNLVVTVVTEQNALSKLDDNVRPSTSVATVDLEVLL
jgi:hypothetical protein